MRIGLLSDTHNNLGALQAALRLFRAEGVGRLVHCGDMTSARTAALLEGFEVLCVAGNVDQNPQDIRRALQDLHPGNRYSQHYHGRLGTASLAVTHSHVPGKLEQLLRAGRYDYVLHGHTHRRRDERLGRTRVINPGALGGTRYESRSVALLDLATDQLDFRTVAEY